MSLSNPGSVMLLLTSIYDNLSTEISGKDCMSDLLPRLFPFFRHTLSSVRLATLRCMSSLLLRSATPAAWLLPEQLQSALRLTFQNLVCESDAQVLEASKVSLSRQILLNYTPWSLPSAFNARQQEKENQMHHAQALS